MLTMALYRLTRGDAPLIVNVPHAGTLVPDAVGSRLTLAARALPDTDWHVEKLYDFVTDRGATLMCATQSRYVVDLNRDPSGDELYAGGDNTELCHTRTFADEPIYAHGTAPTPDEVTQRTVTHFLPYHQALNAEVKRVKARHGYAVLLDGHSIRSEVPRFFAGRLPDLNLGTASGMSCANELQAAAVTVVADAPGFSHVVNGRFKGGWITRHYGRPHDAVHALQLEMAQRCYMDEAPPFRWAAARAAPLVAVLTRLVDVLVAWRPQ
jgi:N-formylglutamate amidohydrolase